MTVSIAVWGKKWTQRIALALRALPAVVRFDGGMGPFVRHVAKLWWVHGYAAAVTWYVAAVSYCLRENADRYRAWLAQRDAHDEDLDAAPDVCRLVVYTTYGLGVDETARYARAMVRRASSRDEHLIVTDTAGATTLETQTDDRLGEFTIAVRQTLSLDSVLAEVRDRFEAFDEIVVLRPGYVIGRIPKRATDGAVLGYGDEDVLTADGRSAPYFKPDFSIDLLLVEDYLSSCLVMTRGLAEQLPREHLDDFASLAYHLVERADRVEHIPGFVCHRVLEIPREAARYLARFVERRYPGAVVDGTTRTITFSRDLSDVSVIIPTRDRFDLVRPCVEGIFASNDVDPEVVILDNGSTDPETTAWLEEVDHDDDRVQVVQAPGEFNWSALNNLGMERASGDVFVFLNNDILSRSSNWLEKLADVAMRPDVGVVGTLLLFPDDRIQHAGVVVGYGGAADHIYRDVPVEATGHQFVDPHLPRNVTAVTGACQAVARRTLEAIGRFDEDFVVVGSDVELCIRAIERGYVNVYLPSASLYHLESQTRSRRDPAADVERTKALVARYGSDPWYNPHLTLLSTYPSFPIGR